MQNSVLQPTDYASLSVRMNMLVEESQQNDYSVCVASLLRIMREQFPALTEERNPVIAKLENWTRSELAFIIQEYSGFSNAAIHMFLEARIRNHWPALTKEIVRNMDEEMGALTRGAPHLELMRYGYLVELGIETDGLKYTAMTHDFIDRMNVLFCNRDNVSLAGALLAFETTAVDEFRVVARILCRYQEMVGGEIKADSLTGRYIAGHVVFGKPEPNEDPEMNHYQGMVEAIRTNVAQGNLRPLIRGFFAVCLELNRWWEQVATEAFQKAIRDHLVQRHPEEREMYASLRDA